MSNPHTTTRVTTHVDGYQLANEDLLTIAEAVQRFVVYHIGAEGVKDGKRSPNLRVTFTVQQIGDDSHE